MLAALHVPVITAENYEADDVIATLTVQAVEQGMDVLIATGDRDALQLVNDHVTVLYPRKGVSDMTRFTPEEVETKYGLSPAQYPDFAALRGDPSDNLPSIPSVGEKTAAKWIREYGSLDQLVDQVDTVKGKVGEKLREHLSSVHAEPAADRARPRRAAAPGAGRPRRPAVGPQRGPHAVRQPAVPGPARPAVRHAHQRRARGRGRVRRRHRQRRRPAVWVPGSTSTPATGRTGLIFRGSWGRGTGSLDGLALAAADGHATFVDVGPALDVADEQALAAWLGDPSAAKAVHEVKGPLLAIWARGWELAGETSDTALAAYLAMPGQRSFDLGDLAVRYLRRELKDAAAEEAQLTLDGLGPSEDDVAAEAAQVDLLKSTAVKDLADALEPTLEQRSAGRLLTELELPLTRVLAAMEARGIAADVDYLRELQREFAEGVAAAAAECYAVIGREVNLGSPKQLQAVIFDELGLPKTKKNKTGYTTDAEALTWLLEQTGHPFMEHLLRHRDVTRLRTVIDGLLPMVDDVGRIHTTFQQTIAATGRLSSTDPNLQNIPIRTAEGRRIRQAFVVGQGFESLMTADYSQIEMRIMAHLSEDAGLIEAFTSGEDLHSFVASRAFDIPIEDVDPEMRRRIKAMSYGLAYGLTRLRAGAAAADHARGGARPDARLLRALRRRPRLPRQRRRRGADDRLHRDDPGPAPLPARPDQRQPAAPGDGRADGAQRPHPGLGRRRHQGRDARRGAGDRRRGPAVADAAAGARRARARGRGGGAGEAEELVRREMAGAAELSVALEVSVGFGDSWDGAAH